MRKEATLEQWKTLYEAATKIKEQKPWEQLWDMDLIGIQYSEDNIVFFSILGHGGDCYGIAVYEGYKGLNSLLMLTMQEQMNLSTEYAMFNQTNLTCYWGNREELSDKQRKIIKDLGYKYCGKNQWLYFMSFVPGYYPYNLDEAEVLRMSEYLQDLGLALECYKKFDGTVSFDKGNMFLLTFGEDKTTWHFGEAQLPFCAFQFGSLMITDEQLLDDLSKVRKCGVTLEADIFPMGVSVSDKKYDRPGNPVLSILLDAQSGTVVKCDMSQPNDDPMVMLAEMLIDFIFQYGAPKEIRVSNVIVEAGVEQICEVCGIKLKRVKRLQNMEEFKRGMGRFGI